MILKLSNPQTISVKKKLTDIQVLQTKMRHGNHFGRHGIMSGGVWNGVSLGKVRREVVPCKCCGEAGDNGHLLWDCSCLALVHLWASSVFVASVELKRASGQDAFCGKSGFQLHDDASDWKCGPVTIHRPRVWPPGSPALVFCGFVRCLWVYREVGHLKFVEPVPGGHGGG